jgi:hypothetical protein
MMQGYWACAQEYRKDLEMKKFVIRDVETVKTTAALYGCNIHCWWECLGIPD